MSPLFLSPHALERCREMNLTHADVQAAVENSTRSWPDRGRRVYCDGRLLVVIEEVDDRGPVAVTVSWDTPGQEYHDRTTGAVSK